MAEALNTVLRRWSSPVRLPRWGAGLAVVTKNTKFYGGVDPPASAWTSWGQDDIQPFTDDVTKWGDLP